MIPNVEYFPTANGEMPDSWTRDHLGRGHVVVQVYSTDPDSGVMRRSQVAMTREMVHNVLPGLLGLIVARMIREHCGLPEEKEEVLS